MIYKISVFSLIIGALVQILGEVQAFSSLKFQLVILIIHLKILYMHVLLLNPFCWIILIFYVDPLRFPYSSNKSSTPSILL